MKNVLLLAAALAFSSGLFAQKFTIAGAVADAAGQPLTGASVALQHPWGELVQAATAGADGSFEFRDIGRGGYALKITMLGFEDLTRQVTLTSAPIHVGRLQMTENARVLGEAVVKEQMVQSVQKQDTMQFNAGAFKVMKDANADELVEKIPGVTMEKGQMKAHGENVQQVLVDGKPFFGNDPTAALKSLPAEIIEKVQIFDAQSEQSRFTGFSDGNTTKTINIVTKNGAQQGQFGKVYAGYGLPDKYQAGGNINVFDGNRRLSFIGMSNNINVQNFSTDDILGVVGGGSRGGGQGGNRGGGGQGGGGNRGGGNSGDFMVNTVGGVAATHAFGLNYSDKWGKKVDATGSYFLNKSDSKSDKETNRQFLNGSETYAETSTTRADNLNHRFNFRLEWQIDSLNSLMLRPRLTVQQNAGNSAANGQTLLGSDRLNATDNVFKSDLTGLNFGNSLLLRHKFRKTGRTVSLDVSNGYAPKRGTNEQHSVNFFQKPQPALDSLDQRGTLDVNSWNASANLEYTEPIAPNTQLSLNYRHSYQEESSERLTRDWSAATGDFDQLNAPLSNVFSNDYTTRQVGTGINYNRGSALNLSGRISAQSAALNNAQTFPAETVAQHRFFDWLPSVWARWNLDKNRNLRANYRASTQLPSVEQLQNVVNNTNPLQLTAGNPALRQALQHNFWGRYQASNPAKSTTLFFMLGGTLTRDYIGNSTFFASSDNPIFADLNVQPGAQLTLPVNLDGQASARSFFSYGLPIRKIKCNLNFDLSYNFSRTPGLVNDLKNVADVHSIGSGLTLSSNISERVDFTLSARPAWNRSSNSQQAAANAEYLSESSRLKFNWQIIEGFVLRTDLTHTLYAGLADGFNQNYWLWNLGIGKKIFKNQRGEITLAVNDLLDQNRSIQRTVTESYIEDVQTNALTRFVMLSFTYNLRHFNTGKKASAPERSEEERRRMWGW